MITSPVVQSLLIVLVGIPLVWAYVRYIAMPMHRWVTRGRVGPLRYWTVKGGEYFLYVMLVVIAIVNVIKNS